MSATLRQSCWFASLAAVLTSGCGRSPELGPTANSFAAEKIRAALEAGSEGGGDEAAAATGEGWATLRGRFKLVGEPPAMPPYAANKDAATCAPGGQAPPQEFLVVDDSGGIANVVLFVRGASRVHESAAPRTEPVVFDQKQCVFLTHVTGLTVGQTMQIKNSDDVGHNTNISGLNSFNQTIPAGETVDFAVKKEEATPAPVRCSIHPWMLAYLIPRKDGYFAVTKPDGSFELPNLPAGEPVEIQVWHESGSGPNGALVLDSPLAKELKWSKKGRFVVRLEAEATREEEFEVPRAAFVGG